MFLSSYYFHRHQIQLTRCFRSIDVGLSKKTGSYVMSVLLRNNQIEVVSQCLKTTDKPAAAAKSVQAAKPGEFQGIQTEFRRLKTISKQGHRSESASVCFSAHGKSFITTGSECAKMWNRFVFKL